MIELAIPGDANEMGPNRRIHWRTQINLKKRWRALGLLAATDAMDHHGVKPVTARVVVSWVLRRGRRIDPDNAASSGALKALLDGFVIAGLIPGDSLKHCERGSVEQETGKQWADDPWVIVRIEETEG